MGGSSVAQERLERAAMISNRSNLSSQPKGGNKGQKCDTVREMVTTKLNAGTFIRNYDLAGGRRMKNQGEILRARSEKGLRRCDSSERRRELNEEMSRESSLKRRKETDVLWAEQKFQPC
jgi:hypothetical protein